MNNFAAVLIYLKSKISERQSNWRDNGKPHAFKRWTA